MPFSDLIFLYVFLPILFLLYYICPNSAYRRTVLTLFSLVFYAFGEPIYVFLMIGVVLVDWLLGLAIGCSKSRGLRRLWLTLAVVSNLGVLVFYKYLGFITTNVNNIFNLSIPTLELVMPIGISFFTFQVMSYVVDVYRGDADVQKSFGRLLLYVSLFPQLIAGPIVRYKDIADQLDDRRVDVVAVGDGMFRFAVGLVKKVVIADRLGAAVTLFVGLNDVTIAGRWFAALFYTLQLYFDFSGYSDMAIGLGKMLGFSFLENFNYPLISSSATEFWRRWHMSLGTFFRDYVYIPLGGNRKYQLRNIFVVWFLTGLWHGASWNFILWGLFYGVLLTLEKTLLLPLGKKIDAANNGLLKVGKFVVSHAYTIFITVFGFAIFYFDTNLTKNLGYLFGVGTTAITDVYTNSVLYENLWLLLVACIFACPIFPTVCGFIRTRLEAREEKSGRVGLCYNLSRTAKTLVLLAGVALSTILMAGNTYSAFLYFRF